MEKFSGENQKYDQLRERANDRYGEGAEFAYPTPDKKFAMLTLDQALQICGQYIVAAGEDQLWQTLDRFYETANRIKQKSDKLAALAREIGQNALEKYN